MTTFTVPTPKKDPVYRGMLLGMMQAVIDQHPRSAQQMVGPSEVGTCERKLAWKLCYGSADGQPGGWAAHRGTVLHEWCDKHVFGPADMFMPDGSQRFFSDMSLDSVHPHIHGGTTDLYDRLLETVVDLKFPGDWSMDKVKAGDFSTDYYVQAMQYAYHLIQMGYKVSRTALLVMPACGDDLHGPRKGAEFVYWDYDESVAVEAMKRVDRIISMRDSGAPVSRILKMMDTQNSFCQGCPVYVGNGDRRAMCPGATVKNRVVDRSENPFAR